MLYIYEPAALECLNRPYEQIYTTTPHRHEVKILAREKNDILILGDTNCIFQTKTLSIIQIKNQQQQ